MSPCPIVPDGNRTISRLAALYGERHCSVGQFHPQLTAERLPHNDSVQAAADNGLHRSRWRNIDKECVLYVHAIQLKESSQVEFGDRIPGNPYFFPLEIRDNVDSPLFQ